MAMLDHIKRGLNIHTLKETTSVGLVLSFFIKRNSIWVSIMWISHFLIRVWYEYLTVFSFLIPFGSTYHAIWWFCPGMKVLAWYIDPSGTENKKKLSNIHTLLVSCEWEILDYNSRYPWVSSLIPLVMLTIDIMCSPIYHINIGNYLEVLNSE